MHEKTTAIIVTGLGLAVTGAGLLMDRKSSTRDGIIGFGAAHILLGALDMMRSDW